MCRYLGFYQQSEASIAITHPHARKSVAIYRGTELWITSITPSLRCVPSLFHANMADAHLYDIVVNTAVLDLERKVRQLSIPTGELGPATGLACYPGAPGDFRSTN